LPGAVAEIFFIGAEDIGLEEEAKDLDFSGASGTEEDDAWGALEEEKGFDGGDFAEDGLFDGVWEALDETFEFIVEREKEGWFHKVEGRGGRIRICGVVASGGDAGRGNRLGIYLGNMLRLRRFFG